MHTSSKVDYLVCSTPPFWNVQFSFMNLHFNNLATDLNFPSAQPLMKSLGPETATSFHFCHPAPTAMDQSPQTEGRKKMGTCDTDKRVEIHVEGRKGGGETASK